MNPAAVALFLTLLWLVAGIAALIHDFWSGQTLSITLGQWHIPLAVPCLLLAAFNFVRWWAVRNKTVTTPSLRSRRPRQADPESEPNPAFRFDEPTEPRRSET